MPALIEETAGAARANRRLGQVPRAVPGPLPCIRSCSARRSVLSASSCAACPRAVPSSAASRHSMPRVMSVRRPAAFSRGAMAKPRSLLRATAGRTPRDAEERLDARARAPRPDPPETLCNQNPVVEIQRHEISNGAERHQVEAGRDGLPRHALPKSDRARQVAGRWQPSGRRPRPRRTTPGCRSWNRAGSDSR